MDIKLSKSIFARLLAQEDIKVHHAKVQTASFDTKSRTLTLPIWTDMDGDLYDLLCGHEVGHALYTPAQGWHDAICGPGGDAKTADMRMKGFLNVLEDARIEKKIKSKYPGLRANFYRAYQGLNDKDFFQIQGKDINELLLIDRINLHFKLGSFIAVKFSEAEKSVVKRVENLETWDQVEALARELMAMCEEELKGKQEQIRKKLVIRIGPGEMSDSEETINLDDYDEIEYEFDDAGQEGLTEDEKELLKMKAPISETDRAFREREDLLLDSKSRNYEYATLPTINADPYIMGYKRVLGGMKFDPEQETYRAETLSKFKSKNDKVVNYLVKEFELRRNADQLARAKISKSGEIDVKRVFSYRYNVDLFKRVTTVPMGKNHGLIIFFDMSGSMSTQMGAALEQMLVLVEFCRKVNIPFEVYGFTNGSYGGEENYAEDHAYRSKALERQPIVKDELNLCDAAFHLRQYFSDTMSPMQYKQMVSNLVLLARVWHRRARRYAYRTDGSPMDSIPMVLPDGEELNGTPLNQAIMLSIDIYNKFVKRTKAQVVNMTVLTDGDTDDRLAVSREYKGWDGRWTVTQRRTDEPHRTNIILTHKETRKSVQLPEKDQRGTQSLVALVREVTGCNFVCFDIVSDKGRRVIAHKMFNGYRHLNGEELAIVDHAVKKFRQDRIYIIESLGFNEYYLIPGGDDLDIDDDEIDVENGADKKKLFKAFAEMQNNKATSRILLNRFVKMIA